MTNATALLAAVLLGCNTSGTILPPDGGVDGPAGWIYASWGGQLTIRVNAATGEIQPITWPNPPVTGDERLWSGNISPIDGDLVNQGKLGRFWDRLFILDVATGEVHDYGTEDVDLETLHKWSPDGTQVVFMRRAPTFDTRNRLVRLTVATGVTDTLLTPDEAGGSIDWPFWIGSDTVGVELYNATGGNYIQLPTATKVPVPFDEVPYASANTPVVSADQRWMAHWVSVDSTLPSGAERFYVLRLRDRASSTSSDVLAFRTASWTTGSVFITFSPDSKFLAGCPTDDDVTIYDVRTATEVVRYPLPAEGRYCDTLDWSWGPEGPPQ
jgi:hypothetical protein